MLKEFKPKKSTYGFKTTVYLSTLTICAQVHSLLKDRYNDDTWVEMSINYSDCNFNIYTNDSEVYWLIKHLIEIQ